MPMALPRPALLATAGILLSLLSFTVMRTIGAQGTEDFPLPAPAAQTPPQAADDGASKAKGKKPEPPPVPKVEDVPPAAANALAAGKVVVLLFVEPGAAEDEATERNFRALSKLGKDVSSFRASIADIGDYAGIVANLGITQAPSIVIVRPDLRAVPPIEGYVESGYLVQRVKDQLP